MKSYNIKTETKDGKSIPSFLMSPVAPSPLKTWATLQPAGDFYLKGGK